MRRGPLSRTGPGSIQGLPLPKLRFPGRSLTLPRGHALRNVCRLVDTAAFHEVSLASSPPELLVCTTGLPAAS